MAALLFVSPDRVGPEMAGPGVRYFELARRLCRSHDVLLAAPAGSAPLGPEPDLATYDPERPATLRPLLRGRRVVVAPPLPPRLARGLASGGRSWIVDLYNPEPFEGLEHQKARPRLERKLRDIVRIDRIAYAIRSGAAFVCASERQRDMWLGFLAAGRRLESDRYACDPQLRTLVDVVPFGVPEAQPAAGPPRIRGPVFPADARIMVWNGGLWDWLDPATVLRALALLHREDDSWRLVFAGTVRPSHREQMTAADEARRLADELGLGASGAVHFRSGWTPYEERASLLLECDVGVSAHRATLESRFAYRARMLDFLWTRLPIVSTDGDDWSTRIAGEGLGEVAPAGDPEAFAAAVRRVAESGREEYVEALAAAAAAQTWSQAAEPLARLVETLSSPARRALDPARTFYGLRHSAVALAGRARR